MLSQSVLHTLQSLSILANSVSDFADGLKLTQLYIKLFHSGSLPQLQEKMIRKEAQKNGNRIINVNILLRHMQSDPQLLNHPYLKQVNKFQLLDSEDQLAHFIEWMVQEAQPFDNLFFASEMEKVDHVQCEGGQKPVKKGSFKLIRPPSAFTEQQENRQQSRKTLMKERPPLYPLANRSKATTERSAEKSQVEIITNNTEQIKNAKEIRSEIVQESRNKEEKYNSSCEIAAFQSKRKISLNQSIQQIDRMIEIEEFQTNTMPDVKNNKQSKHNKQYTTKQSIRKQYTTKQSIRKQYTNKQYKQKQSPSQLPFSERKKILQWLIDINITPLNTRCQQLQEKYRNGTLFNQLVNYYKGRGGQTGYFRQPKRQAEMRSNYQKVFFILQNIPSFNSNLLFSYECFVPYAQENAFWSLLHSIYTVMCKRNNQRRSNIQDYKSTIRRTVGEKEDRQNKFTSINCINKSVNKKYKEYRAVSQERQSKEVKNVFNGGRYQNNQISVKSLIQIEEPNQQCRGYKDIYLNKFKQNQTPKKVLKSSRRRQSSLKKSPPPIPLVTLQMQMGSTKYIKDFLCSQQIQHTKQNLFKDIFRNGVLLNKIISYQYQKQLPYKAIPKNIQALRHNHTIALNEIRRNIPHFPCSYSYHSQNIIKGDCSLLYGAVWYIIEHRMQPTIAHYKVERFEVNEMPRSQTEEDVLHWVRELEQHSPNIANLRIRDYQDLVSEMCVFLYSCAELLTQSKITPAYRGGTTGEVEGNIKKVVNYLAQCKVIRSNLCNRVRHLAKREKHAVEDIIQDLMWCYRQKHRNQLALVKYQRNQIKEVRLDTTMANQTVIKEEKVEVEWVRKLGYQGDLSLKNGVMLCRLVSQLTMRTIRGVIERPNSKAECLNNIRKAIKQMPKGKWDQYQIYQANQRDTREIYEYLRDKYKHSYALKNI